jgi:hypothetical protein
VKCGNQVDCIYAGLICDGTQQCPDGSDEDKEICTQGKYCVFITGFLTRLTRRVPLVEQELLILPAQWPIEKSTKGKTTIYNT